MSEEILINVTPQETRVAILQNGILQELFLERANRRGIAGNVYKGKVTRIMPGMDAAFVDIGLDKAAFLHLSSMLERYDDEKPDTSHIRIVDLLRDGQELLVQVIKDPMGSKGARLTTQITIPSRFLVFLPNGVNIAVSARIENEDERQRLISLMNEILPDVKKGGYIVRTLAEDSSAEHLRWDAAFLQKLWSRIEARFLKAKAGECVHEDQPLILRTLRDTVNDGIEKVWVDSREASLRMMEFAEQYMPEFIGRIEYYTGERPIFDLHSIEDEIKRSLEKKVVLKSGGYLVIDQTESMTTIDVNTGGFIGHRTFDDTVYKTNLEAAQAIARQLRLRNLGGIIIIDFIDMQAGEHRQQVREVLTQYLEKDHARTEVFEMTELGLIQMTRKRTSESLEHLLCEPCESCNGRGFVKTTETMCYEVFREVVRVARLYKAQTLVVMANQDLVDLMMSEQSVAVAELESYIGVPIRLQVEAVYHQDQYDVVMV